MIDYATDPGYRAYVERMEAYDERAKARRGQPMPHSWGDPIETPAEDAAWGAGYFCEPCWMQGEPTGFHPFSEPPCDPIGGTR